MAVAISSALGWTLKLLLGGGLVVYLGLVLMIYATDGPRYRARFDPQSPFRSVERLLLWLGVKILAAVIQALKAATNIFAEASAEVGEWFMARRSPEAQAEFRSHVL